MLRSLSWFVHLPWVLGYQVHFLVFATLNIQYIASQDTVLFTFAPKMSSSDVDIDSQRRTTHL